MTKPICEMNDEEIVKERCRLGKLCCPTAEQKKRKLALKTEAARRGLLEGGENFRQPAKPEAEIVEFKSRRPFTPGEQPGAVPDHFVLNKETAVSG